MKHRAVASAAGGLPPAVSPALGPANERSSGGRLCLLCALLGVALLFLAATLAVLPARGAIRLGRREAAAPAPPAGPADGLPSWALNPAISGTPHSEVVRLPERPDVAPEPLDGGFELSDPDDDTVTYALRILSEAYREDSDVRAVAGHKADAAEREVERAVGSGVPAVYGEILPETAGVMLRRLGALPGHRFYDLGSGSGKVVVLAWLLGMDATGIEVVTSRWEASCRALEALRSLSAQPLVRPGGRLPRLRHVLASLMDVDFSDADVVFADSALFSADMMRGVAATAGRLRPGSLLISSDRSDVASADLRLLRRFSGASSWSNSSAWKVHAAVRGATAGWRNDEVTWGNPERPTARLPPGSRVCEL